MLKLPYNVRMNAYIFTVGGGGAVVDGFKLF